MRTSRIHALLLAAGLALAAPARAAFDSYLKLDGIEGESTHQDHKGEFELDSVQFSPLRRSVEIGSRSSGAGAGKVTFNPFSITRKIDKASPKLHEACSTGTHFASATISMRKAGGTQQEYLVVKLHDVMLSSYRLSGRGDAETETFMVNAASATLEYTPTPRAGAGIQNVALAPEALQVAAPPKITGASASAPYASLAVTVTITSTGSCQSAFVDYGDGSIAEGHTLTGTSTTLPAHTYATAGAKTIKVGGRDAPYWPQVPQKAPPQKGANPCTGWAPEVHVTARPGIESAPALRPVRP